MVTVEGSKRVAGRHPPPQYWRRICFQVDFGCLRRSHLHTLRQIVYEQQHAATLQLVA